MAAGDLITQPLQAEFNGLLLGPNTNIQIQQIEGLTSLPPVRTSDVERAQADGEALGHDYINKRSIVITLRVLSDNVADFVATSDAIARAFRPSNSVEPFIYQLPGRDKLRLNARPRRFDSVADRTYVLSRHPQFVIELVAPDPRIYSDELQTEVFQVATGLGGAAFPLSFPIAFNTAPGYDPQFETTFGGSTGPSLNSGTGDCYNAGHYLAYPVATITGPIDNPRIEHTTEFKTLEFNLSLATGESLVVDFDRRTAMLNGTASRYGSLSYRSQWFGLEPGNNILRFAANSTATGSTLTVQWRHAYLL